MFNEIKNFNTSQPIAEGSISKTFISSVFSWMTLALAITGVVAYIFGNNAEYMSLLIQPTGFTGLGYLVMFAPIGFVILSACARAH